MRYDTPFFAVQAGSDVQIVLNNVDIKPTVLKRDSIELHQNSSNSMMPKGLLDQFSRDEVLEIMAFIPKAA